jgi:hypothetical protein
MSIDLKKYDEIEFHPNEKINKKIKAYMIIFDYQVFLNKTTDKDKIKQLKRWEEVFLKEEFYEIIPSLLYRRRKIEEKIKRDNLSVVHRMAYKLSDILKSVINNKSKNK